MGLSSFGKGYFPGFVFCEYGNEHSNTGLLSQYNGRLRAGRSGIEFRWGEIIRLSRPALGPTQPPVQ